MKVKDFDFRVWDNGKYHYIKDVTQENAKDELVSIAHFKDFSIGENDELELFTGFTDREGNKIYEGDTIDEFSCGMLMNNPCEIVFKNGCFCRKFANKEIAFVEGLEQGKEQESLAKIFANCVIIRNKEYEYQGEYDDDWVEKE